MKFVKSLCAGLMCVFCFFSCKTSSGKEMNGTWKINSFEKDGVVQQLVLSEITFTEKSNGVFEVNGNSGINNFFGEIAIKDGKVNISDKFGSTKMAGSPEEMEFEDDFMACLLGATKIETENQNGINLLKIYNTDKKMVLSFKK